MFAAFLAVVLSASAAIASPPDVDRRGTPPAGIGAPAARLQPTGGLVDGLRQEVEPIDVNTADARKLQEVPGIGEALAARIIAFRDEHGPFEKVDDLLNVRGIGVKSLDKLRPYLTVKPVK